MISHIKDLKKKQLSIKGYNSLVSLWIPRGAKARSLSILHRWPQDPKQRLVFAGLFQEAAGRL